MLNRLKQVLIHVIIFTVFILVAQGKNASAALIRLPQNTFFYLHHQSIHYRIQSAYEKYLIQDYLQHYYLPWKNPLSFFSSLALKYNEHSAVMFYKNNPGWNENKKRHQRQWVLRLAKNMDLKNFPNKQRAAITINRTNLRLLPTEVPSFENIKKAGLGFPFDTLQVSLVNPNIPIYVVHTSKDGAWDFVITPSTALGWVEAKNVAYVNAQFMQRWQQKQYDYLTPEIDHSPVKANHAEYYFSTRIGELYPLVKRNKKYDKILVAARDVNGNAVIRMANISHRISHLWPIKATSKNIARLANHFLGQPYGWGGMYGYRDCSATTRDLFGPFAIWLPRHSTQQGTAGVVHNIANKSSDKKRQLILKRGIPFFTLLWMQGHILLYIGRWHNHAIVFHSPWGIHTKSFLLHQAGRIVIGRAVITPLDLGEGFFDVPKTWLDQINSFTYLVPAGELVKEKSQRIKS